ncbi:MAG: hypothetical protein JSR28_15205 [Proteobacteria bacterium]|nr:hypothetical protein [Pseudomonadota bacterium]
MKKAGDSTTEGAGRLYRWLQDKLAGRRANEALEDLRAQPQDGNVQATLRVQLRKALEAEPPLAEELAALLGELTPESLGVTQAKSVSGDGAAGIQVAGNGNAVNVR